MRVHLETYLDCAAHEAWSLLQRPTHLRRIMFPLLRFAPVSGKDLPETWTPGEPYPLRMYLFGLIPVGRHTINFVDIDHTRRVIETEESGSIARRWAHKISIRRAETGATIYEDDVEVDAGFLTRPVWLFAQWLYRHRQSKWRKIARGLAPGDVADA